MKKVKTKHVIVKSAADIFMPFAAVFGCYVIFHGNTSPGGGFQGGVLVASAVMLTFLGYGAAGVYKRFNRDFLHSSETIAEIIYIIIAVAGVIVGLNFAYNFVFGGKKFDTSMLMNDAVGYHVLTGISYLLFMMISVLGETDDKEEEREEEEK